MVDTIDCSTSDTEPANITSGDLCDLLNADLELANGLEDLAKGLNDLANSVSALEKKSDKAIKLSSHSGSSIYTHCDGVTTGHRIGHKDFSENVTHHCEDCYQNSDMHRKNLWKSVCSCISEARKHFHHMRHIVITDLPEVEGVCPCQVLMEKIEAVTKCYWKFYRKRPKIYVLKGLLTYRCRKHLPCSVHVIDDESDIETFV